MILKMKSMIKVIVGIICAGLMGCTYLESKFPDKERDYQYTSEIPMINLPPELRRNKPTGDSDYSLTPASPENGDGASADASGGQADAAPPTSGDGSSPPSSLGSEENSVADTETSGTEVTPADEYDARDTVTSVAVVKYDDGESRLRLGAGHARAWRVVNKALSRNTIEVTERNHDQSRIKVQYDPNEKKARDESFMDEISFIFHGIGVNDQEYILKLEEHGNLTDVIVLNDEFLPMLNDNDAVRLLRLLADTIKADLAKKAKEEQQDEPSEQSPESNSDEVKAEEPKPEETESVETKPDTQKLDAVKSEGQKPEESPPTENKPEELKLKALKQLIPPVETPKEP